MPSMLPRGVILCTLVWLALASPLDDLPRESGTVLFPNAAVPAVLQRATFANDLVGDTPMWLRLSPSPVSHQPQTSTPREADGCLGVFVGSVDAEGLVACMGTPSGCRRAGNTALFSCADILAQEAALPSAEQAVGLAVASGDDLTLVYHAPSGTAPTALVAAFFAVDTAGPCPLFDVAPLLHDASDDAITTLALTRSAVTAAAAVPTHVYIGPAQHSTFTVANARLDGLGEALLRWRTLTAVTETGTAGSDSVCVWTTGFYSDRDAFQTDIDVMMHPPVKRLVTTVPRLIPAVPGLDVYAIMTVYSDGAAVDTVFSGKNYEHRALRVGACMSKQVLQVVFVTQTGSILHNSSVAFSPKQMCAVEGAPLDCFCEQACTVDGGADGDTNGDTLFGADDPDCSIPTAPPLGLANPYTGPLLEAYVSVDHTPLDWAHAIVSRLVIPVDVGEPEHHCMAVDIDTHRVFTGVPTGGPRGADGWRKMACSIFPEPGAYVVYHGFVSKEQLRRGIVGPAGAVYRGIGLCRAGVPRISERMDTAGDEIAYLHVDDGMVCPPYTTKPATDTWIVVWSRDGTVVQTGASRLLWYPTPGVYEAVLYASLDHLATGMASSHTSAKLAVVPHVPTPPQMCPGVGASVTYTHLPRLTGDHEAEGIVTVAYLPDSLDSPALQSVWSIQVTTNGTTEGWYEYDRVPADTMPRPYIFPLHVGTTYAVRVMCLVTAPDAVNLFMGAPCYIDAGTIAAAAPVTIKLLNPVVLVTCPGTLVAFQLLANVELPPPTSGYAIDILSSYELPGERFVYEYALGPYDADAPASMLVLHFDFGSSGRLALPDLRDIVAAQSYLPLYTTAAFHLEVESLTTHSVAHNADVDGLYHCGASTHEASVYIHNNSPFATSIHVGDIIPGPSGRAPLTMMPTDSPQWHTIPDIAPPPLTSPHPTRFTFQFGGSTRASAPLVPGPAVAATCPPITVQVPLAPFVPVDVTAAPVQTAGQPASAEQQRQMCAGRVAVEFTIPSTNTAAVRYMPRPADAAAGMGAEFVVSGQRYYLEAGRTEPVVLDVYHGQGDAWQPTGCSVAVAVAAATGERWTPRQVPITLVSKNEPPCNIAQPTATGSAILAVPPGSTLVLRDGQKVVPHVVFPAEPRDGRYIYQGLALGHYVATASVTSADPADALETPYTCTDTTSLVLGHSIALDELIVVDETTTGSKEMVCPLGMYGSATAWRESYTVTLQNNFCPTCPANSISMRVWDMADGTTAPASTPYTESGHTRMAYRLPTPGRYTGEITVARSAASAASSSCRYFLPSYTVAAPMYAAEDFTVEFASYPTCHDAADGVLLLRTPENVRATVRVVDCEAWVDGQPCARALEVVDAPADGAAPVILRNAPFVRRLELQIDIMGACRLRRTFILGPSPLLHPYVTDIALTPSCSGATLFEPAYRSPLVSPADAATPPQPMLADRATVEWTLYTGEDRAVVADKSGGSAFTTVIPPEAAAAGPVTVEVTVLYNNRACRSRASLSVPADAAQPRVAVEIDPVAPHAGRVSLPVFCPGANDAFLWATLTPPRTPESTVTWTDGTGAPVANIMSRPQSTMVHSIGAGEYTVEYTYVRPGATPLLCTVTDTVVVPRKPHYNVLSHMHIRPAECNGGTASATMASAAESGDGCLLEPEFDAFTSVMLRPEDRQYVRDNGYGARSIEGVPNGRDVYISVPYPNAYRFRETPFCPDDLRIVFGRAAPLPVFAATPDFSVAAGGASAALSLHVPYWHGETQTVWTSEDVRFLDDNPAVAIINPGVAEVYTADVTDTGTGCVQTTSISVTSAAPVLQLRAEPAIQHLPCDYTAPQPVAIYVDNRLTGEATLIDTVRPSKFALLPHIHHHDDGAAVYTYRLDASRGTPASRLGYDSSALEATFIVVTPRRPVVTDFRPSDDTIGCSGLPTMTAAIQLDMGDMVIVADHTRVHAGEHCIVDDADVGQVSCTIPRDRPTEIHIEYVTNPAAADADAAAADTTCTIDLDTAPLLVAVAAWTPPVRVTAHSDHTYSVESHPDSPQDTWALARIHPGVHHVVSPGPHNCPVAAHMVLPPNPPMSDIPAPLTLSHISPPSCPGSRDGFAIINLHNMDITTMSISEAADGATSTVDVAQTDGSLPLTGLGAGVHWAYIEMPDTGSPFVLRIDMPAAQEPILIVQPQGLPPPVRTPDHSMTVAMRATTAAALPVDVYMQHGTAQTRVAISSDPLHATDSQHGRQGAGQLEYTECATELTGLARMPYVCRHTMLPGRHYTFSTTCDGANNGGDDDAIVGQERRRRKQQDGLSVRLAYQPTHTAVCTVTRYPVALNSLDGEVQVAVTSGIGPFLYMWPADGYSQTSGARTVTRRGLGVGTYTVVVHDLDSSMTAATEANSCRVVLAPQSALVIKNAVVEGTRLCGADTRATIRVDATTGVHGVTIAAWDPLARDPPIASCNDPRLHPPLGSAPLSDASTAFLLDVGVGAWRVALCDGETLIVTPEEAPLTVAPTRARMAVVAADGELCRLGPTGDNALVTKAAPVLTITNARTPVTVTDVMGDVVFVPTGAAPLTDVASITHALTTFDGTPLPPGKYTYTVADAWGCPVDVSFANRDTGAAPCGGCDATDRSCYGCDAVPYSGLTLDDCGECGGDNTCFKTCVTKRDAQETPFNAKLYTHCVTRGEAVVVTGIQPIRVAMPGYEVALTGVESALRKTSPSAVDIEADTVVLDNFFLGGPVRIVAHTLFISDSIIAGPITFHPQSCRSPSITVEGSKTIAGATITVTACPSSNSPPAAAPADAAAARRHDRRRRRIVDPESEAMLELLFDNSTAEALELFGDMSVIMAGGQAGEIKLVSATGEMRFVGSTDTNIDTIDITGFTIPGASTAETTCVLFNNITHLTRIRNGDAKYRRSTFDCTQMGYDNQAAPFTGAELLVGLGGSIFLLWIFVVFSGYAVVGAFSGGPRH